MKPIIGICGKSSSGKDASAAHLVRYHGYKQISLAEPIKDFAGKAFGFTQDQLWGSSSKRNETIDVDWENAYSIILKDGPKWLDFFLSKDKMHDLIEWAEYFEEKYGAHISARYVLQSLGTEFGRDVLGENVWIDHLVARANFYIAEGCAGIVTSDVRFQNEMDVLHAHHGKVIRLLRNQHLTVGILNHRSEMEQDLIPKECFDFILNNNGSLNDLYTALDTYVSMI